MGNARTSPRGSTWVSSTGEMYAMGNARSSPRSSTWVSSAGEMYAIGNARTSRSGAGVFGLLRELKMRLGSGFVLPFVSAEGVIDRSRPVPYEAFVRHLRNALVHFGLDPADADHYSGHSMRSGAATIRPRSPRRISSRWRRGSRTSTGSSRTTALASAIACAFPGLSASDALEERRGESRARGGMRLLAPSAFLVRWVALAWAGPVGGSSLVSLA